jgi:endonuclease/exonuclease/phosphatase family metal-dependent hydrolase
MKIPADPSIPLLRPEELGALRAQVTTRSLELQRELTWLDTLDVRHAPPGTPPTRLRVALFNVERGSRFEGIVALLRTHPAIRDADVLLLNEVDWGMARSANRHVTRDLAEVLGLGYVFGIEFLELTKGEAAELEAPGENTLSLHGNAILSRFPLHNVRMLRLPRCCSWADGSQLRVGGRMALIAEIETAVGPLTVVCTHLENRTSPEGRQDQMHAVLEAVPAGVPAVVGGDLNTSTIDAGRDDQILWLIEQLVHEPLRIRRPEPYEPLFADVRRAGFFVDEANPADVPTNVPLGIPDPTYWLKLDWIFVRGLSVDTNGWSPAVVPAVHNGSRVSDHDCAVVQVAVPGTVQRARPGGFVRGRR